MVSRHRALARWDEDAMAPLRPSSVFDVGCGRGGTMRHLRETWPYARFAGIELFDGAAVSARFLGFIAAQPHYRRPFGDLLTCLKK